MSPPKRSIVRLTLSLSPTNVLLGTHLSPLERGCMARSDTAERLAGCDCVGESLCGSCRRLCAVWRHRWRARGASGAVKSLGDVAVPRRRRWNAGEQTMRSLRLKRRGLRQPSNRTERVEEGVTAQAERLDRLYSSLQKFVFDRTLASLTSSLSPAAGSAVAGLCRLVRHACTRPHARTTRPRRPARRVDSSTAPRATTRPAHACQAARHSQ